MPQGLMPHGWRDGSVIFINVRYILMGQLQSNLDRRYDGKNDNDLECLWITVNRM